MWKEDSRRGTVAYHVVEDVGMEIGKTLRVSTRAEWRAWLTEHFESEKEIWLVIPKKSSGDVGILYNDAVEEALCFGWIDSIAKTLNEDHRVQRFSPRRGESNYSQPNRERLRWLMDHDLIHPRLREEVARVLAEDFLWPDDILAAIREDAEAWEHYQKFSNGYRRIRIAYIEGARDRPEEFAKRLNNFIEQTRQNKRIAGYGGVDKYY